MRNCNATSPLCFVLASIFPVQLLQVVPCGMYIVSHSRPQKNLFMKMWLFFIQAWMVFCFAFVGGLCEGFQSPRSRVLKKVPREADVMIIEVRVHLAEKASVLHMFVVRF